MVNRPNKRRQLKPNDRVRVPVGLGHREGRVLRGPGLTGLVMVELDPEVEFDPEDHEPFIASWKVDRIELLAA